VRPRSARRNWSLEVWINPDLMRRAGARHQHRRVALMTNRPAAPRLPSLGTEFEFIIGAGAKPN